MLLKWQFNVLTLLGALALLLAATNIGLFAQNRSKQGLLSQQQLFVQQTLPLENVYRDIVNSLADMAVKGNDTQVLQMLASQGINVTVNGSAAPTDTPAVKGGK